MLPNSVLLIEILNGFSKDGLQQCSETYKVAQQNEEVWALEPGLSSGFDSVTYSCGYKLSCMRIKWDNVGLYLPQSDT